VVPKLLALSWILVMLLLGDFTPMLLGRSDDPFIVNRYFRLNKRFVGFLSWDPGDE
jgi:hypothetical protein